MADQNSINLKSSSLTIDPGASGDSAIQLSINDTDEFIFGVDDTDGDAFILSQGSALGTTNTFKITAAGEGTRLLQPAFAAYNSTTDSNVTGDGTNIQPIEFDTEIFDQNSDYDGTTDTFTAPVTGRYRFYLLLSVTGLSSSMTNANMKVSTSNRTYLSNQGDWGNIMNVSLEAMFITECFADMDAADTAVGGMQVLGGAKTVDIVGSTTIQTYFAGYLIV